VLNVRGLWQMTGCHQSGVENIPERGQPVLSLLSLHLSLLRFPDDASNRVWASIQNTPETCQDRRTNVVSDHQCRPTLRLTTAARCNLHQIRAFTESGIDRGLSPVDQSARSAIRGS